MFGIFCLVLHPTPKGGVDVVVLPTPTVFLLATVEVDSTNKPSGLCSLGIKDGDAILDLIISIFAINF